MGWHHVAIYIVATIFAIFAVSALVARFWFAAAFWAGLAALFAYPALAAANQLKKGAGASA
jgi:hypothetical protein